MCESVESEHEQLWTRSQSSGAALHPLPCHVVESFPNDSNQTAGAILWLHISRVYPGRIQPLVDRWWEEHQGQRGRGAGSITADPRGCYFCPWPASPQGQACSDTRDAGRSVMMGEWRAINQREYQNSGNWKRTIQRNCVTSLMSLDLICLPPINYTTSYITHDLNLSFQSYLMGKADDWAHASMASVVSDVHVDKTERSAVKYQQAPRYAVIFLPK